MRKRRAGALVCRNLPPLMGRRDAVLDAAETLIRVAKSDPDVHRGTLFSYLNGLFAAADSNTARLSGMFNNQDTVAREERLAVVEHNLLDQLCEYFDRVRARIARYRQYAVKNFSKEYLDCYQKSYMSVKERCDEAFELFSVKISTPNMRSVSDEKLPD